ncbi:hypothetical protein FRB99_001325 [Tulasnella sp. 403]|nr:hypothetical protein FRB99_001325 [Tulasnella sp. 403]
MESDIVKHQLMDKENGVLQAQLNDKILSWKKTTSSKFFNTKVRVLTSDAAILLKAQEETRRAWQPILQEMKKEATAWLKRQAAERKAAQKVADDHRKAEEKARKDAEKVREKARKDVEKAKKSEEKKYQAKEKALTLAGRKCSIAEVEQSKAEGSNTTAKCTHHDSSILHNASLHHPPPIGIDFLPSSLLPGASLEGIIPPLPAGHPAWPLLFSPYYPPDAYFPQPH